MVGNCFSQECLATTRRAEEKHAGRDIQTKAAEAFRVCYWLEDVLLQLFAHLSDKAKLKKYCLGEKRYVVMGG